MCPRQRETATRIRFPKIRHYAILELHPRFGRNTHGTGKIAHRLRRDRVLACCQSSGIKGGRVSPTPTAVPSYGSEGTFRFERRSHERYPIRFDVEYEVHGGKGVRQMGFGRTINISARGALLDISGPLPRQGPIQLSIKWPFHLDGSIPLKLLMYGKIVRVASNRIAVRVTGHTFHTAGRAMQQA
jgi:hypothetical protein